MRKIHMKTLLIAIFISISIAGCTSKPNQVLDDSNSRLINVKIETNDSGLILQSFNPDKPSANLPTIGQLPIDKNIRIANNSRIEFFISGYDRTQNFVEPKSKFSTVGVNKIHQNVQLKSMLETITQEFSKFNRETKRQILRTLTSYEIVKNSPKMLFKSKLAEADGELSILKIENQNFRETKLFDRFETISRDLHLSEYFGEIDKDVYKNIELIKLATN